MKKGNNQKLSIYFEDKHLLIVYKDGGLSTIENDKYKDSLYSKVYDYLHKKNQRVFIVHRLDRDTSGLVIFAKSEKVKLLLQDNWNNIIREYIAIVHGRVKDEDIIKSYLKETKTLMTYSSNDKNGKYAETKYNKIFSNNNYTLIRVKLITGRKNQIRVHMSDNKTPILGDKKYGKKDGYRKMMLLANKLDFIHPITKERILIDLKIPDKYKKVVDYNE